MLLVGVTRCMVVGEIREWSECSEHASDCCLRESARAGVMSLVAIWIKKAEVVIVITRAQNRILLFRRILKCRAKVR